MSELLPVAWQIDNGEPRKFYIENADDADFYRNLDCIVTPLYAGSEKPEGYAEIRASLAQCASILIALGVHIEDKPLKFKQYVYESAKRANDALKASV